MPSKQLSHKVVKKIKLNVSVVERHRQCFPQQRQVAFRQRAVYRRNRTRVFQSRHSDSMRYRWNRLDWYRGSLRDIVIYTAMSLLELIVVREDQFTLPGFTKSQITYTITALATAWFYCIDFALSLLSSVLFICVIVLIYLLLYYGIYSTIAHQYSALYCSML
jgi:hypothetical protein